MRDYKNYTANIIITLSIEVPVNAKSPEEACDIVEREISEDLELFYDNRNGQLTELHIEDSYAVEEEEIE